MCAAEASKGGAATHGPHSPGIPRRQEAQPHRHGCHLRGEGRKVSINGQSVTTPRAYQSCFHSHRSSLQQREVAGCGGGLWQVSVVGFKAKPVYPNAEASFIAVCSLLPCCDHTYRASTGYLLYTSSKLHTVHQMRQHGQRPCGTREPALTQKRNRAAAPSRT